MITEIELSSTICANCGIVFAIPSRLNDSLNKTGNTFYCPNGHTLSYGEGENKRLKDKLESKEGQLDNQADTIREQEREISNKKGQITKLKKKKELK